MASLISRQFGTRLFNAARVVRLLPGAAVAATPSRLAALAHDERTRSMSIISPRHFHAMSTTWQKSDALRDAAETAGDVAQEDVSPREEEKEEEDNAATAAAADVVPDGGEDAIVEEEAATPPAMENQAFFYNLNSDVGEDALRDAFSAAGNIKSVTIFPNRTLRPHRSGVVEFETPEEAAKAIEMLNGTQLNGREIGVRRSVVRRERDGRHRYDTSQLPTFRNVHVNNLPPSVNEADLQAAFAQYGTIQSTVIAVDDNGQSRSFGYVNFTSHEEALAAIKAANGAEMFGQQVDVSPAIRQIRPQNRQRGRIERQNDTSKVPSADVYVSNLPEDIDEDGLRSAFASVVTVTSPRLARDENGALRGYGFISCSSAEEARRAVDEMNGRELGGKSMVVSLARRSSSATRRSSGAGRSSSREGGGRPYRSSPRPQSDDSS